MDYKKLAEAMKHGLNKDLETKFRQGSKLSANKLKSLREENSDLPWRELLHHYELQRRAKSKFVDSENMIFTPRGLEQSSSEVIAQYHAERIGKAEVIADLCCGIGSDLRYVARCCRKLYAVDTSEEAIECAVYNCREFSNIIFRQEDASQFRTPVEIIYADPDRRPHGKRQIDAEAMQPSIKELINLIIKEAICKGMLIKLSPALDYLKLERDWLTNPSGTPKLPFSWEFISERGTMKEILLCLGSLAMKQIRKAVLLPEKEILTGNGQEQITIADWQKYVIEPAKPIIRSGLVQKLGKILGYNLLDKNLALLTGDKTVRSNFGKTYRVKEIMPFNRKHLQKYLQQEAAGELIIKTRGFPETAENLRKHFKLKGKKKIIVLIVRRDNGHEVAILDLY